MEINKKIAEKGTLARQFIGGVIMDVTNKEQARMAEDAGTVAVMRLKRYLQI